MVKSLRGNLSCYISGTEGHRKLKFGEVMSSDLSKFFEEELRKKTFDLNALLTGMLLNNH